MTLTPSFQKAYPDGTRGGECGDFAHKLVQFVPVGDYIADKVAAVRKDGFKGHYQVGDVLIFDIGTVNGHVAVINALLNPVYDRTGTLIGGSYQLTESNWHGQFIAGVWHGDGLVHHNRTIPVNSLQIVGGFRGPILVPIYYYPLFMKVKLINNHRSDALNAAELADIVATGKLWSNNSLNLVIDGIDTNLTIPYVNVGSAAQDAENPGGIAVVDAPDFQWFHDNVAPFAYGYDAAILEVADADWHGTVNGIEHLNPGFLPATICCHTQDLTEALNLSQSGHYGETELALHEIRHALCAIGGIVDDTHAWFAKPGGLSASFLPQNLDYDLIERQLTALRAAQTVVPGSIYPVPANFGGLNDPRFLAFTPDVQQAMKDNVNGAKNLVVNGFLGKPWT